MRFWGYQAMRFFATDKHRGTQISLKTIRLNHARAALTPFAWPADKPSPESIAQHPMNLEGRSNDVMCDRITLVIWVRLTQFRFGGRRGQIPRQVSRSWHWNGISMFHRGFIINFAASSSREFMAKSSCQHLPVRTATSGPLLIPTLQLGATVSTKAAPMACQS